MQKLREAARPYSVLICAMVFVLIVGGGLIYLAPFPSESGDFASWVQAVGTVIALFIAVGVPLWQVERQRHERLEDAKAVNAVAKRLAELVVATLDNSAQSFANPAVWRRPFVPAHLTMVERVSTVLSRFPLHSLSPDAALTMVHVQGNLATAELVLREVGNDALDDEAYIQAAGRLATLVAEISGRLPDFEIQPKVPGEPSGHPQPSQ